MLLSDSKSGTDMTGMAKITPGGDMFGSNQNLQNEIGILKSYTLNYRVMQELKDFHVTILEVGRRRIAEKRHYNTAPFIVKSDSVTNQPIGVPVDVLLKSGQYFFTRN